MSEQHTRRGRAGTRRHVGRALATLTACAATWVFVCPVAGATADSGARDATAGPEEFSSPPAGTYSPPVTAPVIDAFRLDRGPYGPGNRGLEYDTEAGQVVRSIGTGLIVFAGAVAGRLALTVVHPDGRRSSLTGIASLSVGVGEVVIRGAPIAIAAERLHLGVREGERYVDPAGLFSSGRRRAVLVPLGPAAPG